MKKSLAMLVLMVGMAVLCALPCSAYSENYLSFDSLDYTVQINDDGTADVEIKAKAQLPSSGEPSKLYYYPNNAVNGFGVEKFSVTGTAPCEVVDDETLVLGGEGSKGAHAFTIRYRIVYKDDLTQGYDWFDVDFLLDRMSAEVRSLTAQITLPQTAQVQEWKLFGRTNDAVEVQGIECIQTETGFTLASKSALPVGQKIALHVQCDTGVFVDMPQYIPKVTVENRVCSIAVSPQMVYTVSERMTVLVNDSAAWIGLPVMDFARYDTEFTMELISNSPQVMADLNRYDGSYFFYLDQEATTGSVEVEYVYTMRPKKLEPSFDILILQGSSIEWTENMSLSFSAPGVSKEKIVIDQNSQMHLTQSERLQVSSMGGTITAKLQFPLYGYEAVALEAEYDATLYSRKEELLQWVVLGCALLCLLLCAVSKRCFGTPKKINATTRMGIIAPPDGVNSAEAGYLKDGVLTNEEISTLVLQWIAQGAVTAQESDGEYILTLRCEPRGVAEYEQNLLRTMFGMGKGAHVTTVQMRGKLAPAFATARHAVEQRYKGEHALQTGGKGKWAGMTVAALPLLLLGTAAAVVEGWGLVLGLCIGAGCMAVQMLLSCLLVPLCGQRSGALTPRVVHKKLQYILLALVLLVSAGVYGAVLYGMFPVVPLWASVGTVAICLMAACVSAMFLRRRPMAQTLLEDVKGFYEALAKLTPGAVENAQQQVPHWCSQILPYAIVFHVHDRWTGKEFAAVETGSQGIAAAQNLDQNVEQAQRLVQALKRCAR